MDKIKKFATRTPVYRSPATTPEVAHYTEVLTLPFRVAKKAYALESFSLNEVSALLSKATDAHWKSIVAGDIVPIDLAGKPIAARWHKFQHYQALAYFHQTVRSFLFGSTTAASTTNTELTSTNDYLQWYRNDKVKSLVVDVEYGDACYEIIFTIVRCDLVLMQPDVGMLQLELQAIIDDNNPLPLGLLQQTRDMLRRLYAPYFNFYTVWKGGHFPTRVILKDAEGKALFTSCFDENKPDEYVHNTMGGDLVPRNIEQMPIAPHWRYLLTPFNVTSCDSITKPEQDSYMIVPPGDDRLPSMAFIAVDDPRKISEGDWVRLGFADAPGTDVLPYSRASLTGFETRYCYDRFWHSPADSTEAPSRIMNCGYAFTQIGSSKDSYFFMNAENGAFVAFRQLYVRMGLIAHFQKTALLGATARLSALSERITPTDKLKPHLKPYDDRYTEIKEFYKHFIEFTHVFWFDEVSPQEQGQVLFDMWQRELRTKELYTEVRQELKDLMDYVNAEQAHRQTATTEQFTRTATVLGGVGVVAGLLGMNFLPFENGAYKALGEYSWEAAGLVLFAILFVLLLAWLNERDSTASKWIKNASKNRALQKAKNESIKSP